MYLHTPAVEAGSWWRVDTASGSDTGTTVYAYDGTGPIPNYYVLTGSTVRNTSWDGTARFWSATQTLYLKELTYQGVPNGTVVTSTGVTPAAPVGGAPVDIATISTLVAALPTTYAHLLTTDATSTAASGTLAAWHLTPVDATGGAATWTLPAANSVAAGVETAIKKADTSANTVTASRAGSDLIFGTGSGATSKVLTLAGEAITFVSNGVDRWTVQTSDTPSGVLASTYAQRANNLSDLTSAPSARTSLGLGASAVMSTAQIAADSALTGTYSQAADTLILRRLAHVGATDLLTSVATSRIAYEDNAATEELWANTSSWTLGANATQVSGGYLYAGATQGGGSGMNRAWNLGTTGTGRAVFTVVDVSGGSGGVIVGVSKDAAGATPTAGAAASRGLYFHNSTTNVESMDQGTTTTLGARVAGTYVVVVTADADYLTITGTKTDGTQEYRTKWARAGFSIGNLFIFNSDVRTTTGTGVGPGGWRSTIATVTPRTGIEGVGQTVHWTSISSGAYGVRIALPPTYDSRKPAPLAICFHGNGSDETHWSTNSNGRAVANALTTAGYIALGVAYTASNTTWGAQASLDAYYAAYQYVRNTYAIGPVVFYANSMGGLESLLTLAERRIPGVVAWVGTSPSCSLANAYADPASAGFTALINTAYSIPGSGTYAVQTSGHDPALKAGYAFRGVPMLFLAATDDTTVPKTANTDVLAALVTPYSPIVTVQTGITGGHSFSLSSYTSQITTFFDTYSKG